jgi:two-component system, NtrC family, sensor kinase
VNQSGHATKPAKIVPTPQWRKTGNLPSIGRRRETALGSDMQNSGDRGPPTGQRKSRPKTRKLSVARASNANLQERVAALTRDLKEARDHQMATGEILASLTGTIPDAKPVFEAIVRNLQRLFDTRLAVVQVLKGGMVHLAAAGREEYETLAKQFPRALDDNTGGSRAIISKKVVQFAPVIGNPAAPATTQQFARDLGFNSAIFAPMIRGDQVIGSISTARVGSRPFDEGEVALIKAFADQAVIAIENVRLFEAEQQRTHELSEALEQQTATSEVLQVISRSSGALQPVFQIILESATRICGARIGILFRYEDGAFTAVATLGVTSAYAEYLNNGLIHPGPTTGLGRVASTKQTIHVLDTQAEAAYAERDPLRVATTELGGARSLLNVPMIKEGELIGAIGIYRQEVRPFTDKQIELVTSFASQAVIAIENSRLLNELRESLQQQTATADVLKVISSSPGELEPVFEAMLASATQICGAEFGLLYRAEGELFRTVSLFGAPPAFAEQRRLNPMLRPSPGTALGRVVAAKEVVQIPDVQAEPAYQSDPLRRASFLDLAGARTVVCVPMLKDNEIVGAISIYRQEVRPFTDKQIELVTNFAAQAVIAIENTRLLSELRESLQQQTATSDVLKVISRSTFDLQVVLQTLVESAARLCDADKSVITREKNGTFYRSEAHGFSPEFMDYVKDIPIKPERGSAFGRALLEGRAVQIADASSDPEYTMPEVQRLGDYRTILAVPMLREGAPIGVVSLTRRDVRPFTEKQIELASTFADQAAIAIENVRLFDEVQGRTRELAASLEDLRTTQDRLVQTQKLASLGQLTAGIAHEIKNPLNFVNNFSTVSSELVDELQDVVKRLSVDDKARKQIDELTGMLRGNLDKVVQHGKRADAIVKNMLLHSREGSGEHRVIDINALVEESLNLAYHGARAEKQGFNITLERSFDPAAGQADVFPQDITRVLLNLILNGFYAVTKRKTDADSDGYEPTLIASTRSLGDRVELRIRDNGTGIAPEVKEKIFNPFFTTKPAGEGTGLGLSISYDVIVKQHGGSIEVETEFGAFSEFIIVLPRAGAPLAKTGERT